MKHLITAAAMLLAALVITFTIASTLQAWKARPAHAYYQPLGRIT